MVRLYLEDYVNTYLKRLFPKGGQDLRAGVLLGTAEERDGLPFLFVDGAMEVEDITEPGEKVQFTEQAWRKTYQTMEQMFPKRVVLGWFLCGAPGCSLSPLNYWKEHGKYFAAKNQLMYLNSGLDGEEAIYVAAEDGFCRLRGYSVYYERNQMMQDYMILRKDVRRVETGAGDPVIRDFRQRMEENKSQVTARRGTVRVLGGLCTALGILVLAGGVTMVNNYEKMKEMEAVLTSVLPSGMLEEDAADRLSGSGKAGLKDNAGEQTDQAGQASQVIVEEVAGQIGPAVQAGANGSDGAGSNWETVPAANEGQMTAGLGSAGADGAAGASGSAGADSAVGASGSAAGSGIVGGAAVVSGSAAGSGIVGGSAMVSGNAAGSAMAGNGTAGEEAGTAAGNAEGGSAAGVAGAAADSVTATAAGGASGGAAAGENAQAEGADSGAERAPAREVLAGQTLYLVQPGDTLYGICLEHYGNGNRMGEICELNGLENEDTINAGENLILP